MTMRIRIVSLIAAATTVAGILIGLLAASPAQWSVNLYAWSSLFGAVWNVVWPAVIALLSGSLGLMVGRHLLSGEPRQQFRNNIVDEGVFSDRLEIVSQAEQVTRIDVLSYTAETIADVLKYDFRNQKDLTLRTLSRCWFEEAADEAAYNQRLANSKKRRWSKADSIEGLARSPWTYQGHREQRFYFGMHPLLKLILVHYGEHTIGFCSFYDWQEWPVDGGSPFKGSSTVGYVLDSQNSSDASILRRLQNQYEFIWEYASRKPEDPPQAPGPSVFAARSETRAPDRGARPEVQDAGAEVPQVKIRGGGRRSPAHELVQDAKRADVGDDQ